MYYFYDLKEAGIFFIYFLDCLNFKCSVPHFPACSGHVSFKALFAWWKVNRNESCWLDVSQDFNRYLVYFEDRRIKLIKSRGMHDASRMNMFPAYNDTCQYYREYY